MSIPGPGFVDAEGVYHVGESDTGDGTFSGLMQQVTEPISDQFTLDRARLAALEALVGDLVDYGTYTPTLTGVTVGNGTLEASWSKVGKLVTVEGSFILGSTSAVTAAIKVDTPTTMLAKYGSGPKEVLGVCGAHDVGTDEWVGWVTSDNNTGRVALTVGNTSPGTTRAAAIAGSLFPWTTGDGISWSFTYREA